MPVVDAERINVHPSYQLTRGEEKSSLPPYKIEFIVTGYPREGEGVTSIDTTNEIDYVPMLLLLPPEDIKPCIFFLLVDQSHHSCHHSQES